LPERLPRLSRLQTYPQTFDDLMFCFFDEHDFRRLSMFLGVFPARPP